MGFTNLSLFTRCVASLVVVSAVNVRADKKRSLHRIPLWPTTANITIQRSLRSRARFKIGNVLLLKSRIGVVVRAEM